MDALRLAGASARRRAKIGGGSPNFIMDVEGLLVEAKAAVQEGHGQDAADEAWAEGERLDDDALTALLGRVDVIT
jgi:hypothetical protein